MLPTHASHRDFLWLVLALALLFGGVLLGQTPPPDLAGVTGDPAQAQLTQKVPDDDDEEADEDDADEQDDEDADDDEAEESDDDEGAGEADEEESLGRPWKEIAMDALMARELQDAIFWYRRWLEADPTDNTSWYNLACAYALAGAHDEALNALAAAVTAGWDDAEHTRQDSDLESLRDDPRFEEIVGRIVQEDTSLPPGVERGFALMQSLGTYLVYLPDDYDAEGNQAGYPLVVILHGSGSTEERHGGGISSALGRDGVIYLAVRAPYVHMGVTMNMDQEGYTCWPNTWPAVEMEVPEDEDPDSVTPSVARQRECYWDNPMHMYVNWVEACITAVRRQYRVEGDRVFVIGHSEGAAAALCHAAVFPTSARSTLAYAGYFMGNMLTEGAAQALAEAGAQLTIVHCTGDPVVPFDEAGTITAWAEAGGVEVTTVYPEENTHTLNLPVVTAMREWMHTLVLADED